MARCGFPATCNLYTIPVSEWECIWTFRKPPNVREERIRDKASYHGIWGPFPDALVTEHSAEWPVSLSAQAIRVWTDPGDLVCDPFCGSGTTGVACVNLGRRFVGLEQDAGYCEMARRRISGANVPLDFGDNRPQVGHAAKEEVAAE
jgi:DNA modification methylase